MRVALRRSLQIGADAVATVTLLYVGVQITTLAVGAAAAGAISIMSALGCIDASADASFFNVAALAAWIASYIVLVFAVAMEILRRTFAFQTITAYVAGAALGSPLILALVGYIGPLNRSSRSHFLANSDVVAFFVVIVAGAAGGAVYWLITIKLRAILVGLAKRRARRAI